MSDSAKMLQSYVARIERLEEEKKAIAGDIREIYAEAKANGFDPKIMRKVVAERRRNVADVEEEQALIDTYKVSLGMLRDTPLGDAAMRAAKKDHGRAAPRAAGKVSGEAATSSDAPPSRPVVNPVSPSTDDDRGTFAITITADDARYIRNSIASEIGDEPPDPERHAALVDAGFVHLGGNEYEAPAKSADDIDIPPFLDRRVKQADIEDYTKAAAE